MCLFCSYSQPSTNKEMNLTKKWSNVFLREIQAYKRGISITYMGRMKNNLSLWVILLGEEFVGCYFAWLLDSLFIIRYTNLLSGC